MYDYGYFVVFFTEAEFSGSVTADGIEQHLVFWVLIILMLMHSHATGSLTR
jgi:hypothetical protein